MKLAKEVKVALVAAACLLGMAVIFKNVLHIKVGFMISNSPVWLYILYIITREQTKKLKSETLYWNLAIIFVTLATIILYAFF